MQDWIHTHVASLGPCDVFHPPLTVPERGTSILNSQTPTRGILSDCQLMSHALSNVLSCQKKQKKGHSRNDADDGGISRTARCESVDAESV